MNEAIIILERLRKRYREQMPHLDLMTGIREALK